MWSRRLKTGAWARACSVRTVITNCRCNPTSHSSSNYMRSHCTNIHTCSVDTATSTDPVVIAMHACAHTCVWVWGGHAHMCVGVGWACPHPSTHMQARWASHRYVVACTTEGRQNTISLARRDTVRACPQQQQDAAQVAHAQLHATPLAPFSCIILLTPLLDATASTSPGVYTLFAGLLGPTAGTSPGV
jgi:hypothetical protein